MGSVVAASLCPVFSRHEPGRSAYLLPLQRAEVSAAAATELRSRGLETVRSFDGFLPGFIR